MGKRSAFKRRPHDAYDTPEKAVFPLLPFIQEIRKFAEPCVGKGYLEAALERAGLECVYSGDITTGNDALEWNGDPLGLSREEAIITNPPWTRQILHPMILHFQAIAPTWLLFDADWAHTRQATPFLEQCSHVVSVGRVKWIEDSKHSGKDNAAWYRFFSMHEGGPKFYGRRAVEEAN